MEEQINFHFQKILLIIRKISYFLCVNESLRLFSTMNKKTVMPKKSTFCNINVLFCSPKINVIQAK